MLCFCPGKKLQRRNVGGVPTRSRNGSPPRKGCAVIYQKTNTQAANEHAPPPPLALSANSSFSSLKTSSDTSTSHKFSCLSPPCFRRKPGLNMIRALYGTSFGGHSTFKPTRKIPVDESARVSQLRRKKVWQKGYKNGRCESSRLGGRCQELNVASCVERRSRGFHLDKNKKKRKTFTHKNNTRMGATHRTRNATTGRGCRVRRARPRVHVQQRYQCLSGATVPG